MQPKKDTQTVGKETKQHPSPPTLTDYKHIADLTTAVIALWHYNSQQYIYANAAFTYVSGYPIEEILKGGRAFLEAKIHPDDLDDMREKNAAALKAVEYLGPGVDDSKPFWTHEFRFKHKDGHYFWVLQSGRIYSRTAAGKIDYVAGTSVNIDAQKMLEAKLLESNRSLETSQARLRKDHEQLLALSLAKDDFVSVATHQLRTPATIVKQYIGMMLQNYLGEITETQEKALQTAYDCNERELQTIDDLLNKVRMESGKVQLYKTQFDLVKLIKGIVNEQRTTYASQKQKLNFDHSDLKSLDVSADEHLLRMVIENLVDNASKYSAAGTEVSIHVSRHAKQVSVDIQDQGFGILNDDLEKLFKKFSRIKNAHTAKVQGTGLGLYWAKEVITLHGGELSLKNSSKSGSTFRFTLPLKIKPLH